MYPETPLDVSDMVDKCPECKGVGWHCKLNNESEPCEMCDGWGYNTEAKQGEGE